MGRSIIYGVLNWGLGHATRSSLIIRALEKEGFEPIIASDGAAGEWLQQEFPHLAYRSLRPYGIHYSRYSWQWPSLLMQLPKVAMAASAERQLLKIWVEELKPVGIISDNRLGFSHPYIPSVYLSHQLQPRAGFFSPIAARLHEYYHSKFQEIWVPDEAELNLSGKLSEGEGSRRIGLLSALERETAKSEGILIILSGPEPQRSLLENKILDQADDLPANSILIRGTNNAMERPIHTNLKVFNRLGSREISKLLAKAELVISRSGYSSIMDYFYLGKKAVLIPTPGQSEQNYLARRLGDSPHFLMVKQRKLNLKAIVERANTLEAPEPHDSKLPKDLFSLFSK